MKFFFGLFLISFSAMAIEVAVIEDVKSGNEIMISFTDDSLYTSLDKAWATLPCKTRFVNVAFIKETYINRACRAEAVKFLMNTGYKNIDLGRTFTK